MSPENETDSQLESHDAVTAQLPSADNDALKPIDWKKVRDDEHQMLREWADADGSGRAFRADQLFGLAFSGGGIRSATFNLGVIQALAELRLLRQVDYLSTVSGGGYIGSWLSSWISRERRFTAQQNERRLPEPEAVNRVEEALAPSLSRSHDDRVRGSRKVERGAVATGDDEPKPVRWLRANSNYLTPQVGLLSIDTLTGVATYMRNLVLNLAILTLLTLAALAIARVIAMPEGSLGVIFGGLGGIDARHHIPMVALVSILLSGVAVVIATWWMTRNHAARRTAFLLALTSYGLSTYLWLRLLLPDTWSPRLVLYVVAIGSLVAVIASKIFGKEEQSVRFGRMVSFLGGLVALLAGLGLVDYLLRQTGVDTTPVQQSSEIDPSFRAHVAVWGLPGLLIAFSLGGITYLGLAGRSLSERQREWWGRLAAYVTMAAFGWLFLIGIAIYGPFVLMRLKSWFPGISFAWVVSTVTGVLLARSPSTGNPASNRLKEWLTRLLPYVFIVGLVVALSGTLVWLQYHIDTSNPAQSFPYFAWMSEGVSLRDSLGRECMWVAAAKMSACTFAQYAEFLRHEPKDLWIVFLIATAAGLILAWRVDINLFSFHMFYRNRLVRCYLGASNKDRSGEDVETGYDRSDSPELTGILQRPYHVINTALNVTRSGAYSGWQQRKAMPFFFSPLFCGYTAALSSGSFENDSARREFFQRTAEFAGDESLGKAAFAKSLSLGRALAVSGAAASPNMGYHSSPAAAFLLTVFNVRLGWWMQNTRWRDVWRRLGPKFSWQYLMRELFGFADDQSPFVYLSDGGHFENLGLYELVRRRCRFVVCVDAGCDPKSTFEDLANAVRKCQIDLGAHIDIDTRAILPVAETRLSRYHCVVGTIRYAGEMSGAPREGYLLYIKPSLTGNEPADIQNYWSANPQFPHQSTADQWFDEAQFESYRKLGHHIVAEILRGADVQAEQDIETMFVRLKDRWYPPSNAVVAAFSRHGDQFKALMDSIRANPDLRFLDMQIYPEWRQLEEGRTGRARAELWLPRKANELRAGFYTCNQVIQMMENVYHDLHFEEEEEWSHPDNRGWRNMFKHWSWSGMFRVTYAVCAATYGKRFTEFCRRRLDLDIGQVHCEEIALDFEDRAALEKQVRMLEVDNALNQVEAGYLMQGGASAIEGGLYDQLITISLSVSNPAYRGTMMSAQPEGLSLSVGFATARQRKVVFLRIQDHLRNLGLGRQSVEALLKAGFTLAEDEEIERVFVALGISADEHAARFPELWRSVEASLRTRPAMRGHSV